MKALILFAVIALLLCLCCVIAADYSDCDAKGGALVQSFDGRLVCSRVEP